MPKTKRDMLKRQVAHAYSNCFRAQIHIASVWQQFKDVHPEDAEALNVMLQTLELTIDMLEKFANKAWLLDASEIEEWRNVRDTD
jgi:hypothetical protein